MPDSSRSLMLIRPLSGSSLPGTAILVAQELPARGKLHEITAVWITPHLRTAPLLLLQRVALLQRRADIGDQENVVQIEKISHRHQRDKAPVKSSQR